MASDDNYEIRNASDAIGLRVGQSRDVFAPTRFQVGSTAGFTGSAALLVGTYLSSGSGAIAQFNGFLRIKDQIIIHNASNTANESYLQCTGSSALATGGSMTASSFFESSDIRLKTNITNYNPNGISEIVAKVYEKDGKLELGYIAQDLQGVLDSAISTRDNGMLDLSYRQVHTAKIASLEARVKELESQLKNK
jgi:hypothetical protein